MPEYGGLDSKLYDGKIIRAIRSPALRESYRHLAVGFRITALRNLSHLVSDSAGENDTAENIAYLLTSMKEGTTAEQLATELVDRNPSIYGDIPRIVITRAAGRALNLLESLKIVVRTSHGAYRMTHDGRIFLEGLKDELENEPSAMAV